MTTDNKRLRELALKATPGVRYLDENDGSIWATAKPEDPDDSGESREIGDVNFQWPDIEFTLGAGPVEVIALLDRTDLLERLLGEVCDGYANLVQTTTQYGEMLDDPEAQRIAEVRAAIAGTLTPADLRAEADRLREERDHYREKHNDALHTLANERQISEGLRMERDEEREFATQLVRVVEAAIAWKHVADEPGASVWPFTEALDAAIDEYAAWSKAKGAPPIATLDVPTEPLALARFTIAKYGDADKPSVRLATEVLRLTALINTPRTDEFFEAVRIEAAHQIDRWGVEHDAGKRAEDWLTLYLYLLGKATKAHFDSDGAKLLHHIVTVAAVALNWHRNLTGVSTAMRPGVGERSVEKAGE